MSTTWRERAACRDGPDPDAFFPTAETGPEHDTQVAAAKAICAGCPVQAACLDEALARIPDGIAGGLTPDERRALRAQQGRPTTRLVEVVELGLRPGATPGEIAAAGRVLLASGRPIGEVAARCRVSERTVARWRTSRPPDRAGEGSRGGNRTPLRISHTHSTQAGTPTQEGGRS